MLKRPYYIWLPLTLLIGILAVVPLDMRWLLSYKSLLGKNIYSFNDKSLTGRVIELEMGFLTEDQGLVDVAVVNLHTKKPPVLNVAGDIIIEGEDTLRIPFDMIGRFDCITRGRIYDRGTPYYRYHYYTKIPPKTWMLWILALSNMLWLLWCVVRNSHQKLTRIEY